MSFVLSIAQKGLPPRIDPAWDDAIRAAAGGDADLDSLIRGTIARESGWDPLASRPEPRLNDASEGLMQVLLTTARGIQPDITRDELRDPVTNIAVGGAFLAGLLQQHGNDPDAVSAYNHGSVWRNPAGGYYNQGHVTDVLVYATWYMNQAQPTQAPAPADPGTVTLAAFDPMLLIPIGLLVGAAVWSQR